MLESAREGALRNERRLTGLELALAGVACVLALCATFLPRETAAGAAGWWVLSVLAGAAVVAALLVRRLDGRVAARHAAVQARRRKAQVVGVWGAVGLYDALAGENARRATVRPRRATSLSLAVSSEGLELWSGAAEPALVHSLRWPAIEEIVEGAGAWPVGRRWERPAVVVVTRAGNRLVLVPLRRGRVSVRTASAEGVRTVADGLDDMRASHAGLDVERARAARASGREAGRRRRAGG